MRKLFLVIFFGLTLESTAQVYPQIGARSAGMAGVGLTLNDVYSTYNNPGAFGALEKTAIGLTYENRFLLKELSTQAIAFGYHTEKSGNFGIQFQQYGFSLYREIQTGITYGTKLANRFYGGVTLNYQRIQLAENYGAKNAFSAGIGILYRASDDLDFAVRVQNISRAKLADFENERLPTRFALGLTYTFSERVFWTLEAEKAVIHPVTIKSGLEIKAHDILYLRLGVNSYPFQSAFGFGLKFDNLQFDMATTWHNSLGVSPSAGLKYRFN